MFLDTKHAVDRLTQHLLNSGVRAAALHGGKSQPQRTRTLAQFKTGHVTVLVATNVAARGIHVDNLDLVVNVDPPTDHKDYLHRGGRTARAGESGSVVTLVTPNQRRDMTRLMADAGITPADHPGPLRRGGTEPDHRRPGPLRHPGRHHRTGGRAPQAQRLRPAAGAAPLRRPGARPYGSPSSTRRPRTFVIRKLTHLCRRHLLTLVQMQPRPAAPTPCTGRWPTPWTRPDRRSATT